MKVEVAKYIPNLSLFNNKISVTNLKYLLKKHSVIVIVMQGLVLPGDGNGQFVYSPLLPFLAGYSQTGCSHTLGELFRILPK